MDQQFIKPEAVCALIPGMTKEGLAQLRFKGTGPRFYKPSPRKVVYRESDVLDWLESKARTSTAVSA